MILIFNVETEWRKNSDNADDITRVGSNSVRIVIE